MVIYLECPSCKDKGVDGVMVPLRKRTPDGRKRYKCTTCGEIREEVKGGRKRAKQQEKVPAQGSDRKAGDL